jgi:hypothetical protein
LGCAEARRVAYRDVDVLRVSSIGLTWLVARRLQDSPAAVIAISFDRAENPRLLEWDVKKPVTVGFGADDWRSAIAPRSCVADEVERIFVDIDADRGDRGLGLLRHGGAPRLWRPLPASDTSGQEHGRTIH